jgi:hypothetical protein
MNYDQLKLISASNNFGNRNIKKQQGSTIEIFDYIQLVPPVPQPPLILSFFTDAKNKLFPFTNITDNRIDVGESMLIEYIYFSVALISTGGGIPIGSIETVVPLGTGNTGLGLAQYSWFNDNNRVLKNKSLCSHYAEFNATASSERTNIKELETKITIQPLIPFRCELQIPLIPVLPLPRDVSIFIGCHIKGSGSLFAPKHTY